MAKLVLTPALLLWLLGAQRRGGTANAQVLDISGGASTMYQSQGGTLTLRGQNYETGISAGTVGGHLLAGGHVAYQNKSGRYVLGMEQLNLNLPTDVFNPGHRLIVLGLDIKTTRNNTVTELFAGTTSTRYESPLVQAAKADQAVGAMLLQRPITRNLSLSTQMLFSPDGRTVLQAIEWKPTSAYIFAFAAGMGAGKRYDAVSMVVKKPRLDLKAAYIDTATGFHRTGSQTDLIPEPVRENLFFNWRSSASPRFSMSGVRQHFMSTPTTTTLSRTTPVNAVASVDQLSSTIRLNRTSFSGSAIHSSYAGRNNLGFVASVNTPLIRRLMAGASYFDSRLLDSPFPQKPNRFFIGHFQESLGSRWTANQTVTLTNGQTTAGFGGSFLSNLATLSADYETFYLPTRPDNPFQQSLVFDIQLNLFGRLRLHAGSFISPLGRLMYTAEAHGLLAHAGTIVPTVARSSFAESFVAGRVIDTGGVGIDGAAIEIDGKTLFTDSSGIFMYREKKEVLHHLKVLVDEFLDGQHYWIVTSPLTVMSSSTARIPVSIVVSREPEKPAHYGDFVPAPPGAGGPPKSAPPTAPAHPTQPEPSGADVPFDRIKRPKPKPKKLTVAPQPSGLSHAS